MLSLLRLSLVLLLAALHTAAVAGVKNGFDLSGALIPEHEILPGGPPRDGIPALDAPRFVAADGAAFLQPADRVLGVVRNNTAKAYPVAILNWHEIVNDRFADDAVAVSYCPLCGTGVAYLASAEGRTLKFGVSGLLYNSDLLLYDRETQSLWSQIRSQAVAGPLKGQRLQTIPLVHTTWAYWRQRHPDSLVLSIDTGYKRANRHSPYQGYERSRSLYFPVSERDLRYHPKAWVLGIEIDGLFKAYPFVELEKSATPVRDTLGGKAVVVRYDHRHRTAIASDDSGELLPGIMAYWFAWYAFHPTTEIYRAPD